MNNINRYLLLLISLLLSATSFAAEEWQALVLTTPDVSIATIKANNLILAYQKVEDAITAQLVSADIEVADKTLLFSHASITDQQLFSLNNEAINLAIRYRLNINEESTSIVKKWHIYLSAYIVDLESKKKIETYSEDRLFSGRPAKCDDNCFTLWLAKQAETLAQDLGAILVEKLKSLPRRYRYEIVFNRFTPNELIQVHHYLKKVNGYVYAKLLEKYETKQQWLHQISGRKYRYVSHLPADVLDVALQAYLHNSGITVRNAKNDGRHFVLIRTGIPYLAWYIGMSSALILLLYSFYALQVRRKHQLVLAKLAYGGCAEQWLAYYKNMPMFAVPKVRAWHEQEIKQLADINSSTELSEKAWLYADQGDYDRAKTSIEEALRLNADNSTAKELKDNIVDFQRGYDRYILASKEVETHPEQAKKLLAEAQNLNPHLNEKTLKLIKQCNSNIQFKKGLTVLQQAKNAIESKAFYKAYSLIDEYLTQLPDQSHDNKNVSLFEQWRATLDDNIVIAKGACIGTQDLHGHYFFTANKLELGRKVGDPTNSLAIGYKRISRVGKQCELRRQGHEFYLTDQGSSNGSIYGDMLLVAHESVKVAKSKTLVLGGASINNLANTAACQLELRIAKDASNAIILKLSASALQFIDNTNMLNAWPSMEVDIGSKWILMGGSLDIGLDGQGKLDIGCINGTQPVAQLINQAGYYFQPYLKNNHNSDLKETLLMINNQPIYAEVPVQQNAVISIGNNHFSLQEVR